MNEKEIKTIKWWQYLLLWFVPSYVVIDDGYAFYHKKLFGVLHVVKMEELPSRKKETEIAEWTKALHEATSLDGKLYARDMLRKVRK